PDLDTRADIYALGATLYHMVTGEFPFDGSSAAAIIARHLTDPVPSARDIQPKISRATDELIQVMMAKDRDERPQTPAQLLHMIKDALAGKVTLRPSAPTRPKPSVEHRWQGRQRRDRRERPGHPQGRSQGTHCPLLGMDAAQAAALAALKDDEHGNLTKAVFLLAEGEKLTDAEKFLAVAGNPPVLPLYKRRLDRILARARAIAEAEDAEVREAAARKAWRAILAAAKDDLKPAQAKHLLSSMDTFEAKYGTTKLAERIRDERTALRARLLRLAEGWISLFDGKTLKGWRAPGKFAEGPASVGRVEDGQIVLDNANPWCGIVHDGAMPTTDFEVIIEAMPSRKNSFLMLTFPCGDTHLRLVLGGWAPVVVGLDMIDGKYAYQNETTREMSFEAGRWYLVRLAVTRSRIVVDIDEQRVIDFKTAGRRLEPGGHGAPLKPLGLAATRTRTAIRSIRLRRGRPELEPRSGRAKAGEWHSLFDGKTLKGWRVIEHFRFPAHVGTGEGGRVKAAGGKVAFEPGKPATGMTWTGEFPTTGYDVSLEAMRVAGNDVFCAIRFPVGGSHAGLVVGAHGGGVVALDKVDRRFGGRQATVRRMPLENRRWYRVGLQVTDERIVAWIDGDKVVDLERAGHTFGITAQYESLTPFGLGTFATTGAMRNIRFRRHAPDAEPRGEAP
ncbi:DUF1080 domain-containing protein, partial [bacterium]|nr:DUF1080 domain-containing protein [bacterium]